jgi:hypothetical protein
MGRYINAGVLIGKLVAEKHFYPAIVARAIDDTPTADVVEVCKVSEQIIRKSAEVSDYWQKDVKSYRATQGYSDIEHDTDNFLRGYNEAVEDMLVILGGMAPKLNADGTLRRDGGKTE